MSVQGFACVSQSLVERHTFSWVQLGEMRETLRRMEVKVEADGGKLNEDSSFLDLLAMCTISFLCPHLPYLVQILTLYLL